MFPITTNHAPDVHHVVGNGAGPEIRAGEVGGSFGILKFWDIIYCILGVIVHIICLPIS